MSATRYLSVYNSLTASDAFLCSSSSERSRSILWAICSVNSFSLNFISGKSFDEVWSSTYERTMETASFISPDINISSAFDERKLGTVKDIKYWEYQMKDLNVKVALKNSL